MSQAEVGRAEAASSAASGALSGLSVGSDMLTPLINRAKQQLEVERARSGLHRAMAAAKTDADLPQLDAAIQAARRAGVQDSVTEASRCLHTLCTIFLFNMHACHLHAVQAACKAGIQVSVTEVTRSLHP